MTARASDPGQYPPEGVASRHRPLTVFLTDFQNADCSGLATVPNRNSDDLCNRGEILCSPRTQDYTVTAGSDSLSELPLPELLLPELLLPELPLPELPLSELPLSELLELESLSLSLSFATDFGAAARLHGGDPRVGLA